MKSFIRSRNEKLQGRNINFKCLDIYKDIQLKFRIKNYISLRIHFQKKTQKG